MQRLSARVRNSFLFASIIFLLVGLYLFIFAESVATLPANVRGGNSWLWPIGPLAMRFIATFAFVGTVSSYLVARRPDAATVTAFGSLSIIFGALLLLHSAVNWNRIDWAKPLGLVWVAALALGVLGGVILVRGARRSQRYPLTLPTTPIAVRRITQFLLFLNAPVGATMFFLPEIGRTRWPWDLANVVNVQLFGVVFLGGALAMLWVWRQPSWYGYDILFASVGVFSTIALVASFMHWNLFTNRPITSAVFVILYGVGALLGFYAFGRYGGSPATLPLRQESNTLAT